MKALEYLYRMKKANDEMGMSAKNLDEAIKELEDLENRKCDNCLHIRITQTRDYESAICTNEKCDEMFDCSVGDDFYCNKWESKDEHK